MNNYEFISYKPINDQYTIGLATVRIDKRFIVTYAEKNMKSGGTFWGPATHSYSENGEKKYEPCFYLDSRSDEKMLLDFIRSHANAAKRQTSAISPQQSSYPYSQPQQQSQIQEDFFKGVGENQEQVPF